MKFCLILTGGRSGSDLLQSLFDGHDDIIQFPGIIKFKKPFINIFNLKNDYQIAEKFIKFYPKFFDSRLNEIERHNQLGENKNEFYLIDKKEFIKNFCKFYKETQKSKIDKLICLHKAYQPSKVKAKMVLIHIHLHNFLENFLLNFNIKDLKILLTYRDPLVSFCSTIKNWSIYKSGSRFTPWALHQNYELHFNNFNKLKNIRDKIRVVKLEKLHGENEQVCKKICQFLSIKKQKCFSYSTYHGKKWWGDAISHKYLDGINPEFKNNFDENLFNKKDLMFLENLLIPILKKYNYPTRSEKKTNSKLFLSIFKFEYKVWKNILEKVKIYSLISIPYFYLKRVLLLRNKNRIEFEKLPDEI